MPREQGTPKTGGRQKGTPNKLTADIKSAIEGALNAVGGQRYLEGVARKHPQIFCALLARLIPKDPNVSVPVVTDDRVEPIVLARQVALAIYLLDQDDKRAERDELKAS